MPPFREGLVKIDPRIDAGLLGELRRIGHGHRINIVDASYDIPRGAQVFSFAGTTAEAFEAIVRLVPVDREGEYTADSTRPIIIDMAPDEGLMEEIERAEPRTHVAELAAEALHHAASRLKNDNVGNSRDEAPVNWGGDFVAVRRLDEEDPHGEGFYSIANNPNEPHLFVKTSDDLPFACVSFVVGHSQRTE